MLKKIFFIALLFVAPLQIITAQKKEIALAKDNVKAGKSLVEAENSMRRLLADSANKSNTKIWLVLFDAIKKQYEEVNEKMYLKQSADTASFFSATYRMFGVLEGLDSIDAMPDKNGKVKLNYRKRHAEYLNSFRQNLYNGGLFYTARKNYQQAFDCFSSYLDCAVQPMFSAYDYGDKDSRMPRAAFYAVYNGFKNGNAWQTLRYVDTASKDTAKLDIIYQCMAETYRMIGDTIRCVDVLKSGFARYRKSDYFFSHLFDYYFKHGDTKNSLALCDEAIGADSLNVVGLFAKSTVLLSIKQYEECIDVCNRIISIDSKQADAYLNAALAYFNQAVPLDLAKKHSRNDRTRMLQLYRKALPYMQTYRSLAPDEKSQWAMPLYTIYLNLNMGKEFDEIDALMKK